MEYLRNSKILTVYTVMFLGTIVTDSFLIIGISINDIKVPEIVSLCLMLTFATLAVIAFITRLLISTPQKLIVICNFIFTPIATILSRQSLVSIVKLGKQDIANYLIVACFVVLTIIVGINVLLLPQRFNKNQIWSFAQFSYAHPTFKLIRIVILNVTPLLLEKDAQVLIIGLAIILNFLIVLLKVNYQMPKVCFLLVLTCFSGITSFVQAYYAVQSKRNYYFMAQILCTLIYASEVLNHVLVAVTEMKITNLIKRKGQKLQRQNYILVFRLFDELLFKKNISKQDPFELIWSQNFVNIIQKEYLFVIKKYLSRGIRSHNQTIKGLKLQALEDIGDPEQFKALMSNNKIYLNIIEYFLFIQKKEQTFSIDSIIFFIERARKSNFNYVKKCLFYFHSFNAKTAKFSIFQNVLINELKKVIQKSISVHREKNNYYQQIMLMENAIETVKKQLKAICQNQSKIMHQAASEYNIQNFTERILKRDKAKKSLDAKFKDIMKMEYYYCFNQLPYTYLLYKVKFCKQKISIKQNIRDLFIIPRMKKSQQLKNISQKIIAVCSSGLLEDVKGSLINGNESFRKSFSVRLNDLFQRRINISSFIPKPNAKKHGQVFEQSIRFDKQTKLAHSSFFSYIKCPDDKNNFIKKATIQTRIYYDLSDNLYFICEFLFEQEGINSRSCYIQKDNLKLLKLQSIQFTIKQQIDVTQLQANLKLMLISVESSIPIFGISPKSINQEQSILTNVSNTPAAFDTDKINDKFYSMEQQITSKNSQNGYFNVLLGLKILTIIVLILLIGRLDIYTQNSIRQIQQFVSQQLIMYQQLALIGQKNAYLSVLMRGVTDSKIPNDVCKPYGILDIKIFAKDALKYLYQNNLVSFEKRFLVSNFFRLQVQKVLVQPNFKFFQFKDEDINVSIKKYWALMKSFLLQLINTDIGALSGQALRDFQQLIRKAVLAGDIKVQGGYSSFLFQITKQMIMKQQSMFVWVFYAKMSLVLFVVLAFIFFSAKTEVIALSYFGILGKVNKKFLTNRIAEIQYIFNQMKAMRNNQISNVEFNNSSEVLVKNKANEGKYQNLDEFLKNEQSNSQNKASRAIRANSEDSWTKSRTISQLFATRKIAFTFYLMLILAIIGVELFKNNSNMEALQIIQRFSKFNRQLGITAQNLMQLNFLNIESEITNGFLKAQQSQQMFSQTINQIRHNNINQYVAIFPIQIRAKMMFQSILNVTNSRQNPEAQNFLGGILEGGLMQLISMQQKNSLVDYSAKHDSSQFCYLGCQNMVLFFNYTEKAISNCMQIGLAYIFNNTRANMHFMQIAEIVLSVILIIFLIFDSVQWYRNVSIVKQQVLTFDSPSSLYKNQIYKPYLNKLITKD